MDNDNVVWQSQDDDRVFYLQDVTNRMSLLEEMEDIGD